MRAYVGGQKHPGTMRAARNTLLSRMCYRTKFRPSMSKRLVVVPNFFWERWGRASWDGRAYPSVYCPACINIPNFVALVQTVWVHGPKTWGKLGCWYPGNTLLSYMYYRTFFVALDQTILGVIMEIRTKILTLTHDLSKSLLVIIGTDCEVYSSGVLSKYMRAYLRAVSK